MKRIIPVLFVFAAVFLFQAFDEPTDRLNAQNAQNAPASTGSSGAAASYRDGQQARGAGTVIRVLPDDNDGSRHQRFILRLDSGRTLLIAHNIDLAPRVSGIREGDTVEFFGEFAYNDKGGVIHWTHHDPQGRHPGGWLRHRGRTYQ